MSPPLMPMSPAPGRPSRGRVSAETRAGFQTVFYLSILLGFMLALVLEMMWLGFKGLDNSPVVILSVPTAFGLTCGGAAVGINRLWGVRGLVVIGWSTSLMWSGLLLAFIIMRAFALWDHSWMIVIAMLAGGCLGFRVGLARLRAGDHDIPALRGRVSR